MYIPDLENLYCSFTFNTNNHFNNNNNNNNNNNFLIQGVHGRPGEGPGLLCLPRGGPALGRGWGGPAGVCVCVCVCSCSWVCVGVCV